jgi:hypothetical protein
VGLLAPAIAAVAAPPPPAPGRHWAFEPVRRPAVPDVKRAGWVLNPIDAFVIARLEAEGIEPAPEADRATFIRRVSLDLLGLPPAPAEVDEFAADAEPGAHERLVDRLLASPHHAERWARHWLDLARYADSNGYTIDGSRSIWKYRDWVIDAIHRDLPFDRFTIEQIAGDMLPGATLEQTIATGFHRNTLRNEEGGTDQEQFRVEAVADRVNTTATVFLGLTAGCARCHDHKYDPISQREYFQMFAVFNNADEPAIQIPTGHQSRELPALDTEIAAAEKLLADNEDAVAKRQVLWEEKLAGRLDPSWVALDPVELRAGDGTSLEELEDGSVLARGEAAGPAIYTVVAEAPPGAITAFRLEALTHSSLPRSGPGLAPNGNFILGEIALSAGAAAEPVTLARATADHSQEGHPVEHAIDGNAETGWAINVPKGSLNVDRAAVFHPGSDLGGGAGRRLTFVLRHAKPRYALGRFRISASGSPGDVLDLPEKARRVLASPPAERSSEDARWLADYYRSIDKDRLPLAARVADLKQRRRQLVQSITTSLVMRERKEPRATHVHLRGDFLSPGQAVEGGVPAVLPPPDAPEGKEGKLDRLGFARWLVDRRNPLTPRVTVNRLWQAYFGQGIVATENDFGTQGSPPTHPELLDWLASELVDRGWSLKTMHRMITTSATYRQSSRARPELRDVDPYNKLLGRQERLRLDAETIRDVALAASGLLTREIGGPGVYPPQPQGIYRFTQTVKYWKESEGPDRYRRGMYTYFWRSSPYPMLVAFDAPDANNACTRRVRSNTPLQALTLANDPAFFEMAQALAARTLREAPPDDGERIRRVFRLCLGRTPAAVESRRLAEYLDSQRKRFEAAPREAAAAAAPSGLPGGIDPAGGAAWTAVARVLLNLDEVITRE